MQLILRLSVCIIVLCGASGVKIRFYRSYNFTDFIQEIRSVEKCYRKPENMNVPSFTTDTCLIRYFDANCTSPRSMIMPGAYRAQAGHYWILNSIRVCNVDEISLELNFDITTHYDIGPPDIVPVLAKHKNVCSCTNIPDQVRNMSKWSVNNHGKDLLAYYQADCNEEKWSPVIIRGGHYDDARNIYEFTKTDNITEMVYKIQSFGPNKSSAYYRTSCHISDKQNADIAKLSKQLNITQKRMENNHNADVAELRKQLNDSQRNMENRHDADIAELTAKLDEVQTNVENQHNAEIAELKTKYENLQNNMEDQLEKIRTSFNF